MFTAMKKGSTSRVQFLLVLLFHTAIFSCFLFQVPIVAADDVNSVPESINSTTIVESKRLDHHSADTNRKVESSNLVQHSNSSSTTAVDVVTIGANADDVNSSQESIRSTTVQKSNKHHSSDSPADTNGTVENPVVVQQSNNSTTTTHEVENSSSPPPAPPRKPFRLGPVIKNWDEQRVAWLEKYPYKRLTPQGRPRMVLVTGSPAHACEHPTGDHFLMRSLKNKIDYCRLHVVDIYYNMVVMEMDDFWVKLPIVRKLMLKHPEAEWIWWMDSDAIFTDMNFDIPLERYEGKNLVIHGWENMVYGDHHWTGLNAGIFLLRNCQWSLDLLDMWAPLGEDYDNHKNEVGSFLSQQLKGRPDFEADDQAGLVWLLISKPELRSMVFMENAYNLHGYWMGLTEHFEEMLANVHRPGDGSNKWPFITHFTGCKFCSGKYNSTSLEVCEQEAERAFNFGDNQVLHSYGYKHESLSQVDVVRFSEESTHPLERYGIHL